MASLRKQFGKLKLRVNETKSKVRRATAWKFLGFSFWTGTGRVIRRRVAPQAIKRMKERVRELTRRSAGRSLAQICKPLGVYLKGWKAYFRLADTPRAFADIDGWVRHRLRAVQLKHWKRGGLSTGSLSRDAPRRSQTSCCQQSALVAQLGDGALNMMLSNDLFKRLGVPSATVDLNPSNRRVRTRMPGGVDAEINLRAPMPIACTELMMRTRHAAINHDDRT
jgi:RNA-directed DNA polymerase